MTGSCTFLERIWVAVAPDGRELSASIRVSAPALQPSGAWVATVSLGQLAQGSEDVHGMDSWQAVELAMHHAAKRIAHLQTMGWRFYWDDINREVAQPSELFRGVS